MSEALPRRLAAVVFASLLQVTAVAAQDRLPPIPPEKYDDAQKKAAAEFLAVRKVPVFGPFEILMHSPELMNAARAMGDHLRFKSAIGNTLSELVILITAREWTQDYEWHVHAPIALKAGIKPVLLGSELMVKQFRRAPRIPRNAREAQTDLGSEACNLDVKNQNGRSARKSRGANMLVIRAIKHEEDTISALSKIEGP
jgi:hypothetical protein